MVAGTSFRARMRVPQGAGVNGREASTSRRVEVELDEAAVRDAEFSAFYREGMPRLVAFLRWQGVPLRDAADLAQDAMTEAYRSWAVIAHPRAWVRRVASRGWARRVASKVEQPVAEIPEAAAIVLKCGDIEEWEQRHRVLELLEHLPSRQRQVLAWWLDGYEPMEIADELNMTAESVRASLYKARRALGEWIGGRDG